MSTKRKPRAEVPLRRDENWWLHPALRGQQALPEAAASGALPHRWVRSGDAATRVESKVEEDSAHADLAQLLYRLNGSRPGPVRGFYVVVAVAEGRFAVGQLCADAIAPVQLFEDLVFNTEAQARAEAASMKAAAGTLR